MPLSSAVVSPELASGKIWIDYNSVTPKENLFLSVDELLEREKTKKGFITPAIDVVVENNVAEVQPAFNFITQPANDSVEKKVQESLARLNSGQSSSAASSETGKGISETEPKSDRTYVFSGRLGTISRVTHTKAEITRAKASEIINNPFPITQWQESRYYFYGKGSAGHHSAISHVYSEPTSTSNNV